MIVTTPQEFLDVYSPDRFPPTAPATARAAFLVSPTGFSLAPESAIDNRYMAMHERTDAARALVEHAELASRLRSSVPTIVFPGDPQTPDGVFPNNVFATASRNLIVGAMRHAVRKREADRADIRAFFSDILGYTIVDLSGQPFAAELTGSLVIDHARGIGYCGLSDRCDMAGARAMHEAFDLKLMFCFALASGEYHTNVVLAILASRAAIIAPDGFADAAAADAIAHVYAPQALCLHSSQKAAFAGNAITLSPDAVWMSARAAASLSPAQTASLAAWGFAVCSVELGEIEKAGGSLRCCVAEIF
ncbi:MAG: arginine deiminase-related protein [Rudaea sp.]